jgi:hypothetical protein
MMFVPALVGSILVNTLQDHNRIGLLFSYWVSGSCFNVGVKASV